jgi:hypothetical protein
MKAGILVLAHISQNREVDLVGIIKCLTNKCSPSLYYLTLRK